VLQFQQHLPYFEIYLQANATRYQAVARPLTLDPDIPFR
jgi:hypothetical protein